MLYSRDVNSAPDNLAVNLLILSLMYSFESSKVRPRSSFMPSIIIPVLESIFVSSISSLVVGISYIFIFPSLNLQNQWYMALLSREIFSPVSSYSLIYLLYIFIASLIVSDGRHTKKSVLSTNPMASLQPSKFPSSSVTS